MRSFTFYASIELLPLSASFIYESGIVSEFSVCCHHTCNRPFCWIRTNLLALYSDVATSGDIEVKVFYHITLRMNLDGLMNGFPHLFLLCIRLPKKHQPKPFCVCSQDRNRTCESASDWYCIFRCAPISARYHYAT